MTVVQLIMLILIIDIFTNEGETELDREAKENKFEAGNSKLIQNDYDNQKRVLFMIVIIFQEIQYLHHVILFTVLKILMVKHTKQNVNFEDKIGDLKQKKSIEQLISSMSKSVRRQISHGMESMHQLKQDTVPFTSRISGLSAPCYPLIFKFTTPTKFKLNLMIIPCMACTSFV